MRMCFPQIFLTVKDLDNLYDVNFYVLLSGVTSVCKNVIMLQAKNIDNHMASKEHLLAASGANREQLIMIGIHVRMRDTVKHAYIAALSLLARDRGDA